MVSALPLPGAHTCLGVVPFSPVRARCVDNLICLPTSGPGMLGAVGREVWSGWAWCGQGLTAACHGWGRMEGRPGPPFLSLGARLQGDCAPSWMHLVDLSLQQTSGTFLRPGQGTPCGPSHGHLCAQAPDGVNTCSSGLPNCKVFISINATISSERWQSALEN